MALTYRVLARFGLCVPAVVDRGLDNPIGENNCFLNGVLQILWHVPSFRTAVLSTEHRGCRDDACVYCQVRVGTRGGWVSY